MEAGAFQLLATALLSAGLAIGIAACGCGAGQGIGLSGALTGIARNPEASGKIMTTLLIGLAMIESLAIYALVVSLLLMFGKPQGVNLGALITAAH